METILKFVEVKDYLTKSNLPDCDYVINPYIGCTHACKYCYASFMKRFTGHKEDWGSFIDIKLCHKPVNLKKIEISQCFLLRLQIVITRLKKNTKSPEKF